MQQQHTTATHSAARVRAARAHHARGIRSSKTTATAGVRVLLESSIARVPLGATGGGGAAAAVGGRRGEKEGEVRVWRRRQNETPLTILHRAKC